MSVKMPNFLMRFWRWFRSPSRIAVGTIIVLSLSAEFYLGSASTTV